MELNELIRAGRQEQGLSQADLAERAGTTVRTVRRWEHGRPPSARLLSRVREVLSLSGDGLLELAGGPAERRQAAKAYRALIAESPDLRAPLEPPAFGWRLRQAAAWRGLAAVDVARYLGVNPASVRRWMHGKGPKWDVQRALAYLLDVPVWWLHTIYLDSCELFGHPAAHIAVDGEDYRRLRAAMKNPDGWQHDETEIDDAMLEDLAAEHGLPVDDLRRVAYPRATAWRWAATPFELPAKVDSPVPARITEALSAGDGDVAHPPQGKVVFVASLVDVAEETLARWATGSAQATIQQVHAVGQALCLPSWRLWQPTQS